MKILWIFNDRLLEERKTACNHQYYLRLPRGQYYQDRLYSHVLPCVLAGLWSWNATYQYNFQNTILNWEVVFEKKISKMIMLSLMMICKYFFMFNLIFQKSWVLKISQPLRWCSVFRTRACPLYSLASVGTFDHLWPGELCGHVTRWCPARLCGHSGADTTGHSPTQTSRVAGVLWQCWPDTSHLPLCRVKEFQSDRACQVRRSTVTVAPIIVIDIKFVRFQNFHRSVRRPSAWSDLVTTRNGQCFVQLVRIQHPPQYLQCGKLYWIWTFAQETKTRQVKQLS